MSNPSNDGVAVSWTAVPGLRAAMARQMHNPQEVGLRAAAIERWMGMGAELFGPDADSDVAGLWRRERKDQRLVSAELFSVTAEITRVAVAVGGPLPDCRLGPEDVLSSTGFIMFTEAIGSDLKIDMGSPARWRVVSASWGQFQSRPVARSPPYLRGALWTTLTSVEQRDEAARWTPTTFSATEARC